MSARDHALDLIVQARLPGWAKLPSRRTVKGKLDPRDYALGESIAAVVTRNLLLLRHLIKHYSGRESTRIDPLVQVILAIGLAQLRFFTRIPASAAVDEAVEQAKRLKLGRASGFVNAVLRSAVREPEAPLPTKDDPDVEAYARIVLSHPPELFRKMVEVLGPTKALKLAERHNTEAPTILRLTKSVTDAQLRAAASRENATTVNPADAVTPLTPSPLAGEGGVGAEREDAVSSGTASSPSPLAGEGGVGGEREDAASEPNAGAAALHEHASPLTNPSPYPLPQGEGSKDEEPASPGIAAEKPARGITFRMHEAPRMLVVEGAVEADFARWAAAGLAQVQDPTSANIVSKLDLDECLIALDRCCGLGTKTIQIAEAVGPEGLVVAVDPAKPRIERLKRTIKERGLSQIKPVVAGMMSEVKVDKPFDRVLIDAPCSNSGVLIRRPEARYRQDAKSLQSLCDLQRRILLDTLPHVRPGGQLVYSTCSIWPEENGEQIIWLMQQTDQFEVISVETILPSLSPDADRHHDGGFVAVMAHKG